MNVHHGDCLDVMAGMEPESVDAVVTDYVLVEQPIEVATCYGCGTALEGSKADEVYGLWCQDCGGSSKPTINYRTAIHDAVEAAR